MQGPGGGAVKPPSEREIVNYIRNHTPDIQQLIKHFKKVRFPLSRYHSALLSFTLPFLSSNETRIDVPSLPSLVASSFAVS